MSVMAEKLIAVLTLLCSTAYAQISYRESPYIEGSMQGHYTVIEHKCGSGCVDCALLFIDYDGIRMVEQSLSDKVLHDLFPDLQVGGHFGVVFEGWDIPNNKLFLTVYGNQNKPTPDFKRRVIYDVKTHKVAFK
jgi:hypothetical protein